MKETPTYTYYLHIGGHAFNTARAKKVKGLPKVVNQIYFARRRDGGGIARSSAAEYHESRARIDSALETSATDLGCFLV